MPLYSFAACARRRGVGEGGGGFAAGPRRPGGFQRDVWEPARRTGARMGQATRAGARSKGSATAIGLFAVVLWSMMFGTVRLTSASFGPVLGSALIYTLAAVFVFVGYRPSPLRKLPVKFVLFSGGLFVFYESAITLSIGMAASSEQTVELSLVNYLWPSMLVLMAAFAAGSGRAFLRSLPGALVGAAGVAIAVGGNSGLDWALVAGDIASNPLPFALTFCSAFAWAVYSTFSGRFSQGREGTAYFMAGVAAVLWVVFAANGAPAPAQPVGPEGFLALAGASGCIAAGYACWGHGMVYGDMGVMAVGSYAAPLLSVAASVVLLGVSLSPLFWAGTAVVVAGSLLNWRMSR